MTRGSAVSAAAGGVPIPEKRELRQRHLQPCLLGPGVAAEDVKDNRESVEHLHAPGGFQFLLERERDGVKTPAAVPRLKGANVMLSPIPCLRLSRLRGMWTQLPLPTEGGKHSKTPEYLGGRGQPLHVQKDCRDFWCPSDFL